MPAQGNEAVISVGDSGSRIELDTEIDLSSASNLQIVIESFDESTQAWSAVATLNALKHATEDTVLYAVTPDTTIFTQNRLHSLRAKVTLPGVAGYVLGDTYEVHVERGVAS